MNRVVTGEKQKHGEDESNLDGNVTASFQSVVEILEVAVVELEFREIEVVKEF